MLAGFYTAASGILMQQRTLNVLTNNAANSKTPGYRAERVVSQTFDHELLVRMEGGTETAVGSGSPIRIVRDVPVDFEMSSLKETGRPFDMALVGEGYFNISVAAQQDAQGQETEPAQIYLTRNGSFDVDEEGFLILPGVGRVLGQQGEIQIEGSAYITVEQDGTIRDSEGVLIDTLQITMPAQDVPLEKAANGLYYVTDQANNTVIYDAAVYQGQLEQPNIDVNRELSLVMEAQRAFQSCSQALKIVDAMNQKSSSEIAAL